jgi:hypothetical protein
MAEASELRRGEEELIRISMLPNEEAIDMITSMRDQRLNRDVKKRQEVKRA